MRIYNVKQNKRKIYMLAIILASSGVLLLMTGLVGIPFSAIFQFAGVICFIASIAVFDRYLCGGFHVAIDERRDDISAYPKLYIYTTKGVHNISNAKICIPFNKVVCVQRRESVKKSGNIGITNLCANIDRENICYIEYEQPYTHAGVFFNAEDPLFNEIVDYAKKYSGLEEEDII